MITFHYLALSFKATLPKEIQGFFKIIFNVVVAKKVLVFGVAIN